MAVVVCKAGTVEVFLLFNKEITVKMKKRKDKKIRVVIQAFISTK